MRDTTLLRRLLGVVCTRVLGVRIDEIGPVVAVAPTHRRPRCGGCERRAPDYDTADIPLSPPLPSPTPV